MYKILFFICSAYLVAVQAGYPTDLPRCHAGDTECLKKIISQTIGAVAAGRPDINLPPIEPLHVAKVDIEQDQSSPVAISLNFRDLNVYGLSAAVITKIIGFEANPRTSKFELEAKIPKLSLVGKYKINGKVLILPITGRGAANLTFDNPILRLKFLPKVLERNGKTYIQTEKFKLQFDTTRLHIYLDNLFNGDKLLGDNMNRFLNENWEDILRELKPAVVNAFIEIISDIINKVFSKVSYDDIFEL